MTAVYDAHEDSQTAEAGYEDDWDPDQCTECGRWTEHGILSELDDEFVCDECALDMTHRSGGDCG